PLLISYASWPPPPLPPPPYTTLFRSVLALALAISPACTPGESPDSPVKINPERLAHHEITLATLPAPFATKSVSNPPRVIPRPRSEEHTSELQSPDHLVCRLLLEKKN